MAREQKSIKKNTIYNMLKTFSSIIFPLITFPYVSRVLSPVGIGKYNFSNTYVGYFSLIASLGITTYAIRECAAVRDDQEKLDKVSSQIFSINICTMLIAYAALFISLVFFRKLDSYRNLIIIFSSNILFTIVGADWINSAFEDFRYITLRTFGMQLISLICIFIFVRKPSDVMNYALITVLASGGANILNMFYRRRFCRMRFIKDMGWKKHIPGIVMLFVMILAQQIFSSADITMLGIMKSDYEVGLYATATKIVRILDQVMSSIVWVIMPRTSVYFAERQYDKINSLLKKVLQYLLGLGIPCATGIFMLAPEIMRVVGGEEYVVAGSTLQILMISLMISFFGSSFIGNVIMLSSKKEAYYMKSCIIAALCNVIGNYFLIPLYGRNAAAWTTTMSAIIILIYLLFHVDKNIHINNLLSVIIKPIIGALGMSAVLFMLRVFNFNFIEKLIISIALGALSYFVIMLLLRYDIILDVVNSVQSRIRRRK